MKIILVTGVSAGEDKEPVRKFTELIISEVYQSRCSVELFDPYHYMDKGWTYPLMSKTSATNKVHDVLAYAGSLRGEIDKHFIRMCLSKKPNLIIAHSLGTVIAGRNITWGKVGIKSALFFGSPLWIPGYSQIMSFPFRCNLSKVTNYYSSRDTIALGPLSPLKFRVKEQFDLKTGHDLEEYLSVAAYNARERFSLL